MKAQIKRLVRGTFIYGMGAALQQFLGFLLLPLFTRILTPADYGVIALIGIVTVALSGLYNLGTGNSMGLLYFREQNPVNRPSIVWTNVVLMLFSSLILVLVASAVAPQISHLVLQTSEYAYLFRIAFVTLALTTITGPFYAYLRMEEKAKTYVLLTVVDTIVTLLLSVYLVAILHWGVAGVYVAMLAAKALMLLVTGIVVGRRLPFGLNLRLVKSLVRIGLPSIFGLLAFLVIDFADRQMIERLLNIESLGIYSIGYNFGMVMLLAVNAFGTAWPPFFMSFVNKRDEAQVVFGKVLKYYLLSFGALALLFFVVAKPMTVLLTAPAFHDAFTVVGLVAAAYMLKGCYLILLPGIYFAEKLYWQSAIEWVAALMNIGLNLLLIPRIGIAGAAYATLASYLCLTVLAWIVSRRHLQVKYEWRGVSVLVVGMLSTAAVVYAVSFGLTVPYELAISIPLLLIFLSGTFVFILNKEEKRAALEYIDYIRSLFRKGGMNILS